MKAKFLRWWTEPNPEGVSNKDVFTIMFIGITMFLVFINLGLWIANPKNHVILDKIAHILFPLAF